MSVKPSIRCNCGQRIDAKDILQRGYYVRPHGPSFLYVRFRCSRCKKLGEQYIRQEDWENAMLTDVPSEISRAEKERFESLGPIDIYEQIEFHNKLKSMTTMPSKYNPFPPESNRNMKIKPDKF